MGEGLLVPVVELLSKFKRKLFRALQIWHIEHLSSPNIATPIQASYVGDSVLVWDINLHSVNPSNKAYLVMLSIVHPAGGFS